MQLKLGEMQNYYLTQTLVFLAGVELKKKKRKLQLQNIELIHLFKESIVSLV